MQQLMAFTPEQIRGFMAYQLPVLRERGLALLTPPIVVVHGKAGHYMKIILASSSPRREWLLKSAGLDVMIEKPDVDETPHHGESPCELVQRLAREKAADIVNTQGCPIVAADTIVTIDGEILGKPIDEEDACEMLGKLSGRVHEVYTGFAVTYEDHAVVGVVKTQIQFRALKKAEIEQYVGTRESMDKSGSYAIQGGGAYLIDRVEGSYSNVIGLPVKEVLEALGEVMRARG